MAIKTFQLADSGVAGNTHDIINNYDRDGNFKSLKRYGSNNNLSDNFSYSYYTGTNKVKKVNSNKPADEYTYDANGNVTSDDVNRNGSFNMAVRHRRDLL